MTPFYLRKATADDLDPWVALRLALWPDHTRADLMEECRAMLTDPHQVAFIAWVDGGAIGLIEGSLRGSTQQPYGHIEGWYVDPQWRGAKVAQALTDELENWFLHHWIDTAYSDTNQDYPLSPRAHAKAGYDEVGLIRVFRKSLPK